MAEVSVLQTKKYTMKAPAKLQAANTNPYLYIQISLTATILYEAA